MIAKRIPRNKGTSSPARLVRYILAAQGGIEPESWKRTSDYILDTKSTTTDGDKVSSYRVTNCGTADPAQAATIVEAIQAANKRSKADKTYHLVFSFREGEHPPIEVLHAIEDELCEAIGYADHQRVSAVHINTDNVHVHVAINKVHPTGLQNIEPFFDKQRLMEMCERLEVKYGLERDNHGLTEGKAYDRPDRIKLEAGREHGSRFREFLRQSYYLKIVERPEAETYNDLRELSGSGVAHGPERYSVLLQGHARDRMGEGRPQPVDGVRRARNGAGGDGAAIGGKAAEIEAHAGVESLIGYAAREVAPAMRQAANWQELHAGLVEYGVQIKKRGAGLVIGDAGLGLWCKASECGRDLSMKALTERLGPFERDKSAVQGEARKRYELRPRQPHPSSSALFAEYQRQRQAVIAGRKHGSAAIRAERAQERERIRKSAATQRAIIKAGPGGPVKKMLYANVKAQTHAALRASAASAEAKSQVLTSGAGLPNWNEWLMRRAEAGDVDALAVLRSRAEREERLRGNLLTAERAERAKAVLMESLKPQARKDGTLAYRTADGGLVLDRANYVQAERATAGAALVALSLAAKRFEGQALDVRGTDQFREDVARLAGMHGIRVTFADPGLEAMSERQQPATPQRPQEPPSGQGGSKAPAAAKPRPQAPQRPAEAVPPAVLAWIGKRNSDRAEISDLYYNRLWTPADAGRASYQGRRRMEDGSEVLLLKRGDEMLVKPAGPRVVAKASRWRVGQSVTVDGRGRFIDNSKGIEM